MKPIFFFIFFLLLYPHTHAQILGLKVGMKEKALVKSAMPARVESGLKFLKREGSKTTFGLEVDSSYSLVVTFETNKGLIHQIRKEFTADDIASRRDLFLRFKNKMAELGALEDRIEDQELAHTAAKAYLDQGVRAKAYKHKNGKQEEILIYYHNKTNSVLIEIENLK